MVRNSSSIAIFTHVTIEPILKNSRNVNVYLLFAAASSIIRLLAAQAVLDYLLEYLPLPMLPIP